MIQWYQRSSRKHYNNRVLQKFSMHSKQPRVLWRHLSSRTSKVPIKLHLQSIQRYTVPKRPGCFRGIQKHRNKESASEIFELQQPPECFRGTWSTKTIRVLQRFVKHKNNHDAFIRSPFNPEVFKVLKQHSGWEVLTHKTTRVLMLQKHLQVRASQSTRRTRVHLSHL